MRVAIIGAGIAGACAAWHLARKGAQVTVLDRGRAGGVTTVAGAGGVRCQFAEPGEIRFALESARFYAEAPALIGDDCGLRRAGFLNLIRTEAALSRFERMASTGRATGANWLIIGPDEVTRLVPGIIIEGVLGASFTPDDATANQRQAATAILWHAISLGASIQEQTEVTDFTRAGGRLTGLVTSGGPLECDAAVLASGPWAPELAMLAGLSAPVSRFRRHLFTITCPPGIPDPLPSVFDTGTTAYFRRDSDSLVASAQEPAEGSDTLDVEIDRGPAILAQVARLLPAVADSAILGARAGYREPTPDNRAMIGPVGSLPGLYIAAGFSAHGFSHAPAAGRALADLIIDGTRDPDLPLFDPERFSGT